MSFLAQSGEPVFQTGAKSDIEVWRRVRREVYEHLMLAQRDFVGKLMMLYAAVTAYEAKEITAEDWSLVDHEFVMRLLASGTKPVRETAERWIAGELWDCVAPCWFTGDRPTYRELRDFSRRVSDALGKPCFAYGIKDKRERKLKIAFDDGSWSTFGENVSQWLFGLGSPKRETFDSREVARVKDMVSAAFGCQEIVSEINGDVAQTSLF